MRKIQNISFYVNNKVAQLSLDSGCEGDCIRLDECKRLNINIVPLDHTDTQLPTQADGSSPLKIVGKASFSPYRNKISLFFDGYVVVNLQAPILCGAPFLDRNKIVQELHNRRIVVDNKHYFEETSPYCPNPVPTVDTSSITISNIQFESHKDSITITLPTYSHGETFMVAPIQDSSLNTWPAQVVTSENGEITIEKIEDMNYSQNEATPTYNLIRTYAVDHFFENPSKNQDQLAPFQPNEDGFKQIHIGEKVPKHIKEKLMAIHKSHAKVFDGDLRQGYNGYSGNFEVDFNFINDIPPPIHYGSVPSYIKPEDHILLQKIVDRLEQLNIVAKANSLGIIPKFASPCMLVKKNSVKSLPTGKYETLSLDEK